jgi:hypothetical protein
MINLLDSGDRELIADFIEANQSRLAYNHDIFEILEGNLAPLLEERMIEDLGVDSSKAATTRKSPINVFRKVIDKLTRIYSEPVKRTVVDGTKEDEALLAWYEKILKMNTRMSVANENFNAYLYSLIHIVLNDIDEDGRGVPFMRTIPNHQFLVMNSSLIDPTSPDVIILCMGKIANKKDPKQIDRKVFWVYTDSQFVIMDGEGEIISEMMAKYQMLGSNLYEILPFTYTNQSQNLVMPSIQSDNKEMAILIPLLLTDLNYAVKYQAFSVFYGIDVEDKGIKISPNVLLNFESKQGAGGDSKPQFDVIKPTVDIAETLSLASSQMSLFLVTKGLRAAAIGQLGTDQFASGISKMIDESDAYDAIKKQINVFVETEDDFWNVKLRQIHSYWIRNGLLRDQTQDFSANARIVTEFTEPEPMQTRKDLIDELTSEVEAGFTTVEYATRKLYPNLTEDELKEHIAEAEADRVKRAPKPVQPQPAEVVA